MIAQRLSVVWGVVRRRAAFEMGAGGVCIQGQFLALRAGGPGDRRATIPAFAILGADVPALLYHLLAAAVLAEIACHVSFSCRLLRRVYFLPRSLGGSNTYKTVLYVFSLSPC